MALDRVIRWDGAAPDKDDLGKLVEDYFAGAGDVRWDTDRWLVRLPGVPSSAFGRISEHPEPLNKERWIEVWPDKDSVYVMTRMQDEFTNGNAENLAVCIARYWDGRRED